MHSIHGICTNYNPEMTSQVIIVMLTRIRGRYIESREPLVDNSHAVL
jgi:hypothetical protein